MVEVKINGPELGRVEPPPLTLVSLSKPEQAANRFGIGFVTNKWGHVEGLL